MNDELLDGDWADELAESRAAQPFPATPVTPDPNECGVMGLCHKPKGHEGLHETSVDRALEVIPQRTPVTPEAESLASDGMRALERVRYLVTHGGMYLPPLSRERITDAIDKEVAAIIEVRAASPDRPEPGLRAALENMHAAVCVCPFDGSDDGCNLAVSGTQLALLLRASPDRLAGGLDVALAELSESDLMYETVGRSMSGPGEQTLFVNYERLRAVYDRLSGLTEETK